MTETRKSCTKVVSIAVVAMVAYGLSFGPACWITSRARVSGSLVTIPYGPIIFVWQNLPQSMRYPLDSYTRLYSDPDYIWLSPPVLNSDGRVARNPDGTVRTRMVWGPLQP